MFSKYFTLPILVGLFFAASTQANSPAVGTKPATGGIPVVGAPPAAAPNKMQSVTGVKPNMPLITVKQALGGTCQNDTSCSSGKCLNGKCNGNKPRQAS